MNVQPAAPGTALTRKVPLPVRPTKTEDGTVATEGLLLASLTATVPRRLAVAVTVPVDEPSGWRSRVEKLRDVTSAVASAAAASAGNAIYRRPTLRHEGARS